MRVHNPSRHQIIPVHKADLFVGNSGTTMRFLTAMVTLGQGEYRLDGVPRMRERPIADLAAALNALDGWVETDAGYPPVTISANRLSGGTATQVAGLGNAKQGTREWRALFSAFVHRASASGFVRLFIG